MNARDFEREVRLKVYAREVRLKVYAAEQAKPIREKIKGAKLFGEPIDEENMDAMIFAAFLLGQIDSGCKSLETLKWIEPIDDPT